MAGIYATIFLSAVVVCLSWPLYFFGDVTKFTFDLFNLLSTWTRIRVVVRNGDILQKKGPYVFVCNHQSSLDVVVMSHFWPSNCTVMMKQSLKYLPFFNFASFLCQAVFVDRFNPEKATQSLKQCANKIIRQRLSVFIFPEGTRNHGNKMLEFKKGAFNLAVFAQIPIVPIVISSYKHFYCKDTQYFTDSGYVIVEVMEPVHTAGKLIQDVPALTDAVYAKMTETFAQISVEVAEKFDEQENRVSGTKKSD